MDIKTITVIGANGTMGTNGSALFAAFGNAKVFMISRDIQKSRNAVERAVKSVRAEGIRHNIVPVDYSMFNECVQQSDLVFESVTEDLNVKKDIIEKVGKLCNHDTIIATGTSGLSITKLAECLPEDKRENFFGVHFFNPPYSMSLCELIPTIYSNKTVQKDLGEYLNSVLFRTVVVVKDSPAFLANRIGFQFMNMALQYAEKYKDYGGIDYIDTILGPFTGRAMRPCQTADFVGLDVHKAIVDNIYNNTYDYNHQTFKLPDYVERLVEEGRLGRKTNCGLFQIIESSDGGKVFCTYDINTNSYIEKKKLIFPIINSINLFLKNGDYREAFNVLLKDNSQEAGICKLFLKDYMEYSIYVAKEVCEDLSFADDAMATGFNWCPPLSIANLFFNMNYDEKYDYRRFFKVG